MKKFKKLMALGLAVAMGVATLAGCGGSSTGGDASSDNSGSSDGQVTIKFVHKFPEAARMEFFEKVVADFEAANPNIKIEIVSKPIPDLISMLQTQNLDIVIDSQPIAADKKTEIKYLKSYAHCFFATDKHFSEKNFQKKES